MSPQVVRPSARKRPNAKRASWCVIYFKALCHAPAFARHPHEMKLVLPLCRVFPSALQRLNVPSAELLPDANAKPAQCINVRLILIGHSPGQYNGSTLLLMPILQDEINVGGPVVTIPPTVALSYIPRQVTVCPSSL